jgi:SAM-dependent methyltransferase
MTSYDGIIRRVIPDVEFHQNRYARELDEVVRPSCRWLDIGAGGRVHWGWLGPSQADLVSRARYVIGCDLLADALASNRLLTASVAADAECLPFPSESFDLVSANMVLEHLPDPARVLTEVARVLAPGGRFVFVTPNRRNPAVWLSSTLIRPAWRRRLAQWIEERPAEDVFVTCYKANTVAAIRRLAAATPLRIGRLDVFRSYPILRRPFVAVLLEAVWIRALRWRLLRRFGANLVGQLEKPGTGAADWLLPREETR